MLCSNLFCVKCEPKYDDIRHALIVETNKNFFSEDGFFKLLNWLKNHNDYIKFIERYGSRYYPNPVGKDQRTTMWMLPDYLIDPETFAVTVAEFFGYNDD